MSIKLSDAQLVMMSAAAQRDDRCLVAPPNLKGGAAQKVAAKLIGAGLAKEIKAKAGMPVWRRDEAVAQSYALKLTPAGAKAIVVDEYLASREAGEDVSSSRPAVHANTLRAQQTSPAASVVDSAPAAASPPAAPRSGTKIAQVIALLQRDSGATLDELVAATDWLPHTTRAALTGLRKRGYTVALDRASAGLGSTYRMRMDHAAGGAHVSSGNDSAGNREAARYDDPSAMPTASVGTAKRKTTSRARQAA